MLQTASFQLYLNLDDFCYSFPLSKISNTRHHVEQSGQKPVPCRKYLEPVPAAGSIQAMTVLVQPATYLELKPSKKHKYCIFAKLVGTLVANNCLFSWVVGW